MPCGASRVLGQCAQCTCPKELSKSGYNVSEAAPGCELPREILPKFLEMFEVFIRFPGKTPWKRIGEAFPYFPPPASLPTPWLMAADPSSTHFPWSLKVLQVAHKEGDFREAISCQYNSLIRRPRLVLQRLAASCHGGRGAIMVSTGAHYLYRKFRFWFQKSTPVREHSKPWTGNHCWLKGFEKLCPAFGPGAARLHGH